MSPFDRWPNGHGFDYRYGFIAGETSQREDKYKGPPGVEQLDEPRRVTLPTQQENLWFHGGTCISPGTTPSTWRNSSRRGTKACRPPVYGLREVHHLS